MIELSVSFVLLVLVPYFVAMAFMRRKDHQPIAKTPEKDLHGLPEQCRCGASHEVFQCGDGFNDEVIVICPACHARGCWYPVFGAFDWVTGYRAKEDGYD